MIAATITGALLGIVFVLVCLKARSWASICIAFSAAVPFVFWNEYGWTWQQVMVVVLTFGLIDILGWAFFFRNEPPTS